MLSLVEITAFRLERLTRHVMLLYSFHYIMLGFKLSPNVEIDFMIQKTLAFKLKSPFILKRPILPMPIIARD